MSQRRKWSLIGIPDHQGVMNVGGRIGSASGPDAFRNSLLRLKGRDGVLESLIDAGNPVKPGHDVSANHALAADLIKKAHLATGLSVAVGGGHDHGYSHLLGIGQALASNSQHQKYIGCINIDAHLDVRKPDPHITSGSPFYLALESGVLQPENLIQFGIQSHCNGEGLWNYIQAKKVEVIPFEELRHGKGPAIFKKALTLLSSRCDAVVISLDLDAASSAFAPGVSAPQSEGFSPSEIIEMMEIAGSDEKAVSLGIFELNPLHDPDGRTSLLAATAAYHFIARALSF